MNNTYEYKRYMRNGQTMNKTGVVRSRSEKRTIKKNNNVPAQREPLVNVATKYMEVVEA